MGISEGIEVVIRSVKTDPVFVTAGVVGVSCLGSQVTLSLSEYYSPRKVRYSNISRFEDSAGRPGESILNYSSKKRFISTA